MALNSRFLLFNFTFPPQLTTRSLGHGELEDNSEEDAEGDDAENDPDDDKVAGAAAETALFLRRWGRRLVAGGALPHWKFTWGPASFY